MSRNSWLTQDTLALFLVCGVFFWGGGEEAFYFNLFCDLFVFVLGGWFVKRKI